MNFSGIYALNQYIFLFILKVQIASTQNGIKIVKVFFPISQPNKGWILLWEVYESYVVIYDGFDSFDVNAFWSKSVVSLYVNLGLGEQISCPMTHAWLWLDKKWLKT